MPRAKKTKTETKPKDTKAETQVSSPAMGLEEEQKPRVASKVSPITMAPPASTNQEPGKPVSSVNPEGRNAGVKSNGKVASDLEAAIRERAYQLYLDRGRTDGYAHEDWARAEEEILGDRSKRTA